MRSRKHRNETPLSQFWGNSHFSPGKSDMGFNIWVDKGILSMLITGGVRLRCSRWVEGKTPSGEAVDVGEGGRWAGESSKTGQSLRVTASAIDYSTLPFTL